MFLSIPGSYLSNMPTVLVSFGYKITLCTHSRQMAISIIRKTFRFAVLSTGNNVFKAFTAQINKKEKKRI